MALIITTECINCDVCEQECPNEAISIGEEICFIKPALCTECIELYDLLPQCIRVCPVDCIMDDPCHKESQGQLFAKFKRLSEKAA